MNYFAEICRFCSYDGVIFFNANGQIIDSYFGSEVEHCLPPNDASYRFYKIVDGKKYYFDICEDFHIVWGKPQCWRNGLKSTSCYCFGDCDRCERKENKVGEVNVSMESSKEIRHGQLCNQLHDTYVRKNADYGDSATRTFKEFGAVSYATRISDKFNRFIQLVKGNEAKVKDESIKDTLIDMANYCLMAVVDMEDEEPVNAEGENNG